MRGAGFLRPKPLSSGERAFAAADERMARAKDAFSRAALSCLARRSDAEQLVAAALREVDMARAELRELADAATEAALLPPARATK